MCNPGKIVGGLVGGVTGLLGVSAAQGAAKRQKKAQLAAETSAAAEAQRAEMAYNKANQKTPDLAAIMAANKRAANGGVGSTFLTGAGGTGMGLLGSTSLLGQ